jgi:hypothetical protein
MVFLVSWSQDVADQIQAEARGQCTLDSPPFSLWERTGKGGYVYGVGVLMGNN